MAKLLEIKELATHFYSFRERCRFAVERCEAEVPPLMDVSNGHSSACWELERLSAAAGSR